MQTDMEVYVATRMQTTDIPTVHIANNSHTTESGFKANPEARLHDLTNTLVRHLITNWCQQQRS